MPLRKTKIKTKIVVDPVTGDEYEELATVVPHRVRTTKPRATKTKSRKKTGVIQTYQGTGVKFAYETKIGDKFEGEFLTQADIKERNLEEILCTRTDCGRDGKGVPHPRPVKKVGIVIITDRRGSVRTRAVGTCKECGSQCSQWTRP